MSAPAPLFPYAGPPELADAVRPGAPGRAAGAIGEITFAGDPAIGRHVAEGGNPSTGYCPDLTAWQAVERAGGPGPGVTGGGGARGPGGSVRRVAGVDGGGARAAVVLGRRTCGGVGGAGGAMAGRGTRR